MIDHVWTVLCGRSVTDRETNNISILEVLEQLNVLGPLPDPAAKAALPVQYEIISLWSRANAAEPEEARGRIKLMSPNGAEAFTHDFSINLTAHPRMRTQLRSIGIPLLGVGRYVFNIEIQRANEEWEVVARIPLQIESVAQPPVEAAAAGE